MAGNPEEILLKLALMGRAPYCIQALPLPCGDHASSRRLGEAVSRSRDHRPKERLSRLGEHSAEIGLDIVLIDQTPL
jgi:hypothetical protein